MSHLRTSNPGLARDLRDWLDEIQDRLALTPEQQIEAMEARHFDDEGRCHTCSNDARALVWPCPEHLTLHPECGGFCTHQEKP